MVSVSLEEMEAIEILVYAARAEQDGQSSWVNLKQALAHLDMVREKQEDIDLVQNFDDNQIRLFNDDQQIVF